MHRPGRRAGYALSLIALIALPSFVAMARSSADQAQGGTRLELPLVAIAAGAVPEGATVAAESTVTATRSATAKPAPTFSPTPRPSSVATASPTASPAQASSATVTPSRTTIPSASTTASPSSSPARTPTPTLPADPVLVGAGDVATCSGTGDEATAALLDAVVASDPGATIFAAGDDAYESGTAAEFAGCYAPSWGRHKARTRPVVGNHDYLTAGAAGYFGYFGAAAGDPAEGYYSFDLGAWHVVVLNSNCNEVGGCKADAPQGRWLTADLAAHPAACTLALWHHPRFTSAQSGIPPAMLPVWQSLYAAGADLVVNGHDHIYERFAPQDPVGAADPARGIREIVVGTGGRSHDRLLTLRANSEARTATTYGVLKLTLHPTGYDWEFLPVAGQSFRDAGSTACH